MFSKLYLVTPVIGLLFLLQPAVHAQSDVSTFGIPQDAVGAVVFSGTKIRNNPNLEDLPFELMSREMLVDEGIDIFKIQQGTLVVCPGEGPGSIPEVAIVLKFNENPTLNGRGVQDIDQIGGYPAKRLAFTPFNILVIDDTTLLFLTKDTAPEKFTKTSDGPIANMVKQTAREPWDAFAVVDAKSAMKNYGDLLKDEVKNFPFLPPPVQRLIPLLDKMESAVVRVQVDPYVLKATCRFPDAETANKSAKTIKRAAEFGAEMGIGIAATKLDVTQPTQAAVMSYFERLVNDVPKLPNFQVDGQELSLTLKDEELLLPATLFGSAATWGFYQSSGPLRPRDRVEYKAEVQVKEAADAGSDRRVIEVEKVKPKGSSNR